MSDRLFDIDDVPEIPLRPPLRRRGAQVMDARLDNDYPPEWDRCVECNGDGWVVVPVHDMACDGNCRNCPVPDQQTCTVCLGMGSIKGMVRLLAGHRCLRCRHPFVTKSDAKMLNVEASPGHWSPCDEKCTHAGMIRVWLPEMEAWVTPANEIGPETYRNHRVEAEWRVLTTHHLDGDKANLVWWNLVALCQRCHLQIQGKVVMERVYPHEHSEWFKPYAAGYYAHVYLHEELTREATMARLDELLALERIA